MSLFSIAGLQLELSNRNNLHLIESEINQLMLRCPWIEMVMLGELSPFGSGTSQARDLPGESEQFFCDLAASHGIWLLPGSMYERSEGEIFNTASVINPAGEVVVRYRKMFPFCPYEKDVSAGTDFAVFEIPEVGKFGVSICYDSWFAETTRAMVCMGAEVILHPTLTNTIDRDAELAIVRASAVSNQCYFVDINVAGPIGNGRSIIVGPGGEVIHQAGEQREVIAVQLDLDYVRRVRESGWQGLGQVLKSFRDSSTVFPQYGDSGIKPMQLENLGPLELPTRKSGE
ncbi:MAG: carbon-nitrogen hydrolase family protein [Porticoccaceae bacterium]|nr:carbon-nitrogen hydrolase family protein [Porticoccaceae bacterium]